MVLLYMFEKKIHSNISDNIYSKLNKQQKLLAGYLSIPPKNEFDRIVLKQGYNELKKNLLDY